MNFAAMAARPAQSLHEKSEQEAADDARLDEVKLDGGVSVAPGHIDKRSAEENDLFFHRSLVALTADARAAGVAPRVALVFVAHAAPLSGHPEDRQALPRQCARVCNGCVLPVVRGEEECATPTTFTLPSGGFVIAVHVEITER